MTTIVSYETIAGTTVTIETDGRAYINAEHAPATATELRQLAMLLLATADELDNPAQNQLNPQIAAPPLP